MTLKELFGKNVKKYRNKLNFSQEYLAEKVGLDATSISAIENGKYFISAEKLENLAKALKISEYDLFYFEDLESNEKIFEDILYLLSLHKNNTSILNSIKKFIQTF